MNSQLVTSYFLIDLTTPVEGLGPFVDGKTLL